MRAADAVFDCVGDFLTALLRHHANGNVLQLITAVADNRSERGNAVGINEYLANLALSLEMHGRTRRSACSLQSARDGKSGNREKKLALR